MTAKSPDPGEAKRLYPVAVRPAPADPSLVAHLEDEGARPVGDRAAGARVDPPAGDGGGRARPDVGDGDVELVPVALQVADVGAHPRVAAVGRALGDVG